MTVHTDVWNEIFLANGQLILKATCQAVDSQKKNRTNEFAYFDLKSCYLVKSKAVFGESNFS